MAGYEPARYAMFKPVGGMQDQKTDGNRQFNIEQAVPEGCNMYLFSSRLHSQFSPGDVDGLSRRKTTFQQHTQGYEQRPRHWWLDGVDLKFKNLAWTTNNFVMCTTQDVNCEEYMYVIKFSSDAVDRTMRAAKLKKNIANAISKLCTKGIELAIKKNSYR